MIVSRRGRAEARRSQVLGVAKATLSPRIRESPEEPHAGVVGWGLDYYPDLVLGYAHRKLSPVLSGAPREGGVSPF